MPVDGMHNGTTVLEDSPTALMGYDFSGCMPCGALGILSSH